MGTITSTVYDTCTYIFPSIHLFISLFPGYLLRTTDNFNSQE